MTKKHQPYPPKFRQQCGAGPSGPESGRVGSRVRAHCADNPELDPTSRTRIWSTTRWSHQGRKNGTGSAAEGKQATTAGARDLVTSPRCSYGESRGLVRTRDPSGPTEVFQFVSAHQGFPPLKTMSRILHISTGALRPL